MADEGKATGEAIGLLMLCLCKQLDPCCSQLIASTAFKDGGFSNPIFRAAFLCVLSQWWAAQQRQHGIPAQQPMAYYPAATQASVAPCTTDLMPFFFTLLGPGFAKGAHEFLFGSK
jgi:hypothetical protein